MLAHCVDKIRGFIIVRADDLFIKVLALCRLAQFAEREGREGRNGCPAPSVIEFRTFTLPRNCDVLHLIDRLLVFKHPHIFVRNAQ
jgi:hypothetical protein